MKELSKVIRCEDCKFSQSFIDPFNGKKRYACGLNQTIEFGGFGDEALMMDNGCENGEVWQGYHGHCVAPEGTFQKIWEDEKGGETE